MKRYKWMILGGVAVIFAFLFMGFNKGFSFFQPKPEELLDESEIEDLTYGQEESETTEEYSEAASKEERPKRVNHLYDNETPYEELITTKYSAEEMEYLEKYINSRKDDLEIDLIYHRIDSEYRFECVREGERVSYVMFQGEDGSLLCAFFDKESHDVYQVERFHEFYSVKDFEDNAKLGVTTLDEMEARFSSLGKHHRYDVYRNRVVKEGTLYMIFQPIPREPFILFDMTLFRDGEGIPEKYKEGADRIAGIKELPEMLPMDKHINKDNE